MRLQALLASLRSRYSLGPRDSTPHRNPKLILGAPMSVDIHQRRPHGIRRLAARYGRWVKACDVAAAPWDPTALTLQAVALAVYLYKFTPVLVIVAIFWPYTYSK